MAIATVQSNKATSGGIVGSQACAFSSTPTVGNIMLACVEWHGVTSGPSGWTKIDDVLTSSDRFTTWYRVVLAGDGTSYTWTTTVSDWCGICMVEMSGQDTVTPINQHTITSLASGTSVTTTAATPSVLNCQPIAFFGKDGAGGDPDLSLTTGWTKLQNAAQANQQSELCTQDALTSDTTTAISCTLTLTANMAGAFSAALVLLAPAVAAAMPSRPSVPFMSNGRI